MFKLLNDNNVETFSDNLSNVSMIETPGPWSEILENWIVSDWKSSRSSKVMKLGDKTLTVSSKISTPNKREVTETDLYLLGKINSYVKIFERVSRRKACVAIS